MRNQQPDLRVRLRHSWATFLRYPLTEEQAAQMASGDKTPLRTNPLHITMTGPVCQRCEQDYVGASYSCPGDPST